VRSALDFLLKVVGEDKVLHEYFIVRLPSQSLSFRFVYVLEEIE